MRKSAILLLATVLCLRLAAQNVTSSHLPIVLINTDIDPTTNMPAAIVDEPKVPGTMKILWVNDSTPNYTANQDSTPFLNYSGRIAIELRGSTSQGHSKKPYGFETRQADDLTNRNVSLLGMPEENDWVLNALNDDNSYLRDCLSFAIGRRLGRYVPRTKYCEVFVNGNFRGLYFLTEKIKIDDGRLDLAKLDTTDNTYPAVSGGYIIKADKLTGGDLPAWSTPAHNYYEDVDYIYHNPKPENITTAQEAYVYNYFDSLQMAMNANDSSIASGYPSLIDIPSFVDYMIMGELTSNVDIYQKSTFFHKDRLGKLRAGPLWDFNLAYGNDLGTSWGYGRSGYNVWQFDNNDNTGSEFWYQLFHNPQFQCQFARRWHQLTAAGAPLCYDSVCAIVDSLQAVIDPVVSRDKQRWSHWFSHTQNISSLKQWLQQRYSWINSQLSGYSACDNPQLPQLVISKINYHPADSGRYGSKRLEFIGISNADTTDADLSGVYFPELGLSYQFPAGSTLAAGGELFLSSDSAAFHDIYGVEAFGEYARNLSNSSQRLVLADAWGNTIDDVTYLDNTPWPAEADGRGPFLTLLDLASDNSLASSWTTATMLSPLHFYDTLHTADTARWTDSLAVGDTLFVFDTTVYLDSTIFVHTIIFNADTTNLFDTIATADTLVTTDTLILTQPEGITPLYGSPVAVYPVPTSGTITIASPATTIQRIDLFTPSGSKIESISTDRRKTNPATTDSSHMTLDITPLPDGIYILQVTTATTATVHRIVKASR